MVKDSLPDWELVLSAASRLQRLIPDAVLVGGTASAVYAGHRFSRDADPMPYDLEENNLSEYKNLEPKWHRWETVKSACIDLSITIFDGIV